MSDLFLSVIIPCYNCEKTIGRVLQSILDQNMKKDLYEVIVSNDRCTDKTMDIVNTFKDKMNIVTCETTRDFHCPGNTRQAALEHVKSEWFTFIDDDDMFLKGGFKKIINFINENHVEYVAGSNIQETSNDDLTAFRVMTSNESLDTWLHGKFYRKKYVLDEFHVHFKEDMFSHEDIFFNTQILSKLAIRNESITYMDDTIYAWISRADSLSRSFYSTDHFYIDTYLNDYIISASEPFFEVYEDNRLYKNWFWNHIMYTLIYSYFYYQGELYRNGSKGAISDNIEHMHNFKIKILSVFKVTEWDVINAVLGNASLFNDIRTKSFVGTDEFVEYQSFRDFFLNI